MADAVAHTREDESPADSVPAKAVAGRRRRRSWSGHGRAHVEVRGIHEQGRAGVARHLERELARVEGVHWAAVNQITARVVVAFDEDQVDLPDILDVVEAVEEAHG